MRLSPHFFLLVWITSISAACGTVVEADVVLFILLLCVGMDIVGFGFDLRQCLS